MATIKTNTDKMRRDSEKIRELVVSANKQMQDTLEGFNTLGKMWDGPAKDTLAANLVKDFENFDKVCTEALKFAADLGNAAAEYDRCEEAVEDAVRKLRI